MLVSTKSQFYVGCKNSCHDQISFYDNNNCRNQDVVLKVQPVNYLANYCKGDHIIFE